MALLITALTGSAILVATVWSLISRTDELGVSVGVVLCIYGAIICSIAWAGWLRKGWAWGMMVAVSLLNACTASSFLQTDHPFQFWLALTWLVCSLVGLISAVLPATRLAMQER